MKYVTTGRAVRSDAEREMMAALPRLHPVCVSQADALQPPASKAVRPYSPARPASPSNSPGQRRRGRLHRRGRPVWRYDDGQPTRLP